MKSEFSDDKHPNLHSTMFSKFLPPPPPSYPYDSDHRFHFTSDSQPSDRAAAATQTPPGKKPKPAQAEDGGETIQVARRPRGRPPGSKNKPKPPVVITREPDAPPMAPHIIEIPSGADVVESLARLARRRGIGLCALSASGFVSNATVRQTGAGSAGAGAVTFHGRLELGSLAGVLLQNSPAFSGEGQNGNLALSGDFSVSLCVPQGHIVGGRVVGPLVAAGTVYVVATSFDNPTYHRLPLDDDEGGRMGSPAASGGGDQMSSGGAAYGCQVGAADGVWAPTARPPEQHPPPPY